MAVINKTVSVAKVTDDVMVKLVDMVKQMKQAAADGVDFKDLPVAINACIVDLFPAIQELNQVPLEMKSDLVPFVRSVELGAAELLAVMLS